MTVDNNNNTTAVLRPQQLAHVFLRTNQFTEMVAWWKTMLGADARFQSKSIAFLGYDAEHHRVAICAIPGTGDKVKSSSGLEHLAFTFGSLEDLTTAYVQRRDLGIRPSWCVHHGITISIYYDDPDGNMVETQVDCYEDMEEATRFMESEAFVSNPVGVAFDPEDLLKRVQAGEDRASIFKRPDGPIARKGH